MSVQQHNAHKCVRAVYHKVLRAYNVGCMMPYMDYEPRSLEELAKGAEDFR